MNVAEYLSRINAGPEILGPTVESLRFLQRKHLLAVPFENLDIHWQKPIIIDIDKFYEKVVTNRRGGFCYELNGPFNELLRSLGFQTRLISARVFNGTEFGPEFDHAAIIATIGDDEYLADVGFGEFSTEPLIFSLGAEQHDPAGIFVVRRFNDEYFEVAKRDGGDWKSEYIFKDIPRELSEFAEICDFQQHSPDSHFTKRKICSILTPEGRKTLTDGAFIITERGNRIETAVSSEEDFETTLAKEFGMIRPNDS